MTDFPTHERRLRKLRSKLLRRAPYWGALAMQLAFDVTRDTETADIDGATLRCNPDWLDTLDDESGIGMMAHEVDHPASGHIGRRGNRELPLWNIAGDWAINPTLKAAGFKLPEGALFPPPEYAGLSAEQMYAAEKRKQGKQPQGKQPPQPQPQAPQPASGGAGAAPQPGATPPPPQPQKPPQDRPGADPGRCGGVRPAPLPAGADQLPPQERAKAQAKADREADGRWKQASIIAAMGARGIGRLGGDAEKHIKAEGRTLIDWRAETRHFVLSQVPTDYSAPPFNKGMLAALKIALPDAAPTTCGPVAIIVDTSGSQWGDIEKFGPEIAGVMLDANPETVTVIYNDTSVKHVETFDQGDEVKITPRGGGGTNYQPPFAWIAAHAPDVIGAIVLGDMENDAWPEPQPYPILWVSTTHRVAPARLGETIHLVE